MHAGENEPEASPLLDVDGIHSFYGKSHILQGVSLWVGRGEVVALLGRNGVGKSTTLKTIMGLVQPSQGRISFEGEPVTGLPVHRLARRGIGYVPEERRIFHLLTVGENLRTGLDRPGITKPKRRELLDKIFEFFPVLAERRNQAGGTLSGRAADAGDCAGDDARTQDHSARRADRGADAAYGGPDPRNHRAAVRRARRGSAGRAERASDPRSGCARLHSREGGGTPSRTGSLTARRSRPDPPLYGYRRVSPRPGR